MTSTRKLNSNNRVSVRKQHQYDAPPIGGQASQGHERQPSVAVRSIWEDMFVGVGTTHLVWFLLFLNTVGCDYWLYKEMHTRGGWSGFRSSLTLHVWNFWQIQVCQSSEPLPENHWIISKLKWKQNHVYIFIQSTDPCKWISDTKLIPFKLQNTESSKYYARIQTLPLAALACPLAD